MQKLIVANWKMNPETLEEAVSLARATDSEMLVIAPPFPFLADVGKVITKSVLGAQDLFSEDKGAFTGEVSGKQLVDLGVNYVIVGHSERRKLGLTDEAVSKEMQAALRDGLVPILCIGEKREDHDSGRAKEVVEDQLTKGLSLVKDSDAEVIVAYEPVWAISTEKDAKPDTPENAVKMINLIKDLMSGYKLRSRFVYGGSVNGINAEDFLKSKEIEGALVGSASLKPEEIKKIILAAEKYEY